MEPQPNEPAPEQKRVPVNWEAVRVLAVAVGVREAARRLGISEEATKKRCTREGWLENPQVRAVTAQSVRDRSAITVSPQMSPAMVLQGEIHALGLKSRLGLARGLNRASEVVETMEGAHVLAQAQNIKATAQSLSLVHGWDKSTPATKIRLEMTGSRLESLSIDQEPDSIDVESELVQSQTWDETGPAQELDRAGR